MRSIVGSLSGSALVLAGWNLLVWGGRIRNIVADDGLAGFGLLWRLGLAGSFVVGSVIVALAVVTGRPARGPLAGALAAYGIVVWTVRGLDIALGSHPAGFIAVHTVLALVTIGLGLLVLRVGSVLDG